MSSCEVKGIKGWRHVLFWWRTDGLIIGHWDPVGEEANRLPTRVLDRVDGKTNSEQYIPLLSGRGHVECIENERT